LPTVIAASLTVRPASANSPIRHRFRTVTDPAGCPEVAAEPRHDYLLGCGTLHETFGLAPR
jgi:hypothetical protein